MSQQNDNPDVFVVFARPAWVVMMVAQLLLGLGLAIALIMKYYMLVFGTLGCTGDDPSIANLLRCTASMVIVAHFLLAAAAFRFAACLFVDRPLALLPPLMIGLVGLFLLFVTGIDVSDTSWALAAVFLVFLSAVSAAVAAHHYLSSK